MAGPLLPGLSWSFSGFWCAWSSSGEGDTWMPGDRMLRLRSWGQIFRPHTAWSWSTSLTCNDDQSNGIKIQGEYFTGTPEILDSELTCIYIYKHFVSHWKKLLNWSQKFHTVYQYTYIDDIKSCSKRSLSIIM